MKTKKILYSAIAVLAGLPVGAMADSGAGDVSSHTFFTVVPHFQTAKPEKETMFRTDRADKKYDGIGGALEIVGYYSQSTKSNELARYFFPFGKTQLNVVEYKFGVTDTATIDSDYDMLTKDVEARHFNIQTSSTTETFSSKIRVCPEQRVGGIGFAYRQTLWRDCETETPKLWLDVSFPVENVQNNMRLVESDVVEAGGAVAETGLSGLDGVAAPRVGNMTQALNQSAMSFGRIDNRCRSKWGVADLEVKLGYATYWGDCCHLDGYFGFVAPTGTKIDRKHAEYVFKPVVGENHHWAILLGSYYHVDAWSHNEHAIRMAYNLNSRIIFKNNQWRTFDLIDKSWSRYVEVYTAEQATEAATTLNPNSGSFGVNYLTQCVEVSPRYSLDTNVAMIYTHCRFTAEIGYNFYARHAEEIRLCKWTPVIAQKNIDGAGDVDIARNIRKHFRFDDAPVAEFGNATIQKSDLNLDSAGHPEIMANIVYGNLGYDWSVCDFPMFASVGGSYEFSQINTTLNRWTVWGKWGISF